MAEESSFDLDEQELRSIEEDLFDLEDELIEMQGTTVRTFEESPTTVNFEGQKKLYTFGREEEGDLPGPVNEGAGEDLSIGEQLEQFRLSLRDREDVKPGQLLVADLRQEESPFTAGLYVLTGDRGRRFYAGRSGQITWIGDEVHVLPVKKVTGNVDADTGDIRYDGSVLVEGSVEDGRLVEATGHVWIMGSVGHSNVKAGGDVVIHGGIKGSEDYRIESHGTMYAQFIENARVRAGGSVISEEVIMHSTVESQQAVAVLEEEGAIVGGTVDAADFVFAGQIGSRNYTETLVRMGATRALQEELSQRKETLEELEEEEEEHQKDVSGLLSKKGKNELTPREDELLRNRQFELNHIRQDLQQTRNRIEEIEQQLSEEKSREVFVQGKVHPGVKFRLGAASTDIDEQRTRTTVRNNENEIEFDSFHEPELDLDVKANIDPKENNLSEQHEIPPLKDLRKHLLYEEREPLFNRELQFKDFLGLSEDREIVTLDVTDRHVPEVSDEEEEEVNVWWGIEVREDEKSEDVRRHFSSRERESVKVRCQSPRKGLAKAADYFEMDPDDLAVKIVEEGSSGFMGMGRKDWLIRVVKRSALKQDEEDTSLQEDGLLEEATGEEDVAGFMNLENSEEGLKLTVHPPEGHGLPISLEDVQEELDDRGFNNEINWAKVEEVVEQSSGKPVIIGPRQRDPEVDGTYNVSFNDRETEAYLTVYPPKPKGHPVTQQEVEDYLESENVQYDEEKVKQVFEEEQFEEAHLIASGKEPDHGRDGEVQIQVEGLKEQAEPKEEDPARTVDHRERRSVHSVEAQDVLVVIKSPTEGEPGYTVRGETIPAEDGEPADVRAGENTYETVDDAGRRIVAEQDGQVRMEEGKVWIEPVLVIDGDLDYETGNVDFDGVVIVKGAILDGFKVHGGKRVEAESIGKAQVKSGGDVLIERGMAGKEEGTIEAEGNVFARFLENCRVRSGGSVYVEDGILHSIVDATEYVVVKGGKRGCIVGGVTRAGEGISVNRLGSSMASKTEVEVGITPQLRDRVTELEQEIDSQKQQFEKVRLGLQGLNELAEKSGGIEHLPEEKQEKQTQLSNVARSIKHRIENLRGELKDLRNRVETSEGGRVHISQNVFPGVVVTIQTATLHVTETYKELCYEIKNGEVVNRPYEALDIDLEPPE